MRNWKIVGLAGMLLISSIQGEEMKFINAKTGKVIIDFNEQEVIVHDGILRLEFEMQGILIPPAFADEFQGKKVVYLNDEDFKKAFTEVYYPLVVKNKQLFQLVE